MSPSLDTIKACLRWLLSLMLGMVVITAPVQADPDIREWLNQARPLHEHFEDDSWTLVMFWSVSCEICARETPALGAFHQEKKERGIRVLGVSIDGVQQQDSVARWMKRHGMHFASLLGPLPDIAAYYSSVTAEQFLGTPTFLIFDRAGELVGVNPGPVRIQAVRDFINRREKDRS